MSLFQARDWWVTKAGDGEEYDVGSIVIGNIDNEPNNASKIVTGSLQGVLRVFYPKGPEYRIEDLVLEQQLDAPILQLCTGHFLPAAPGVLALAVLQPRRLLVCTVEPRGGEGARASYFTLARQYEHPLGDRGQHFTAFNMVAGPFGGTGRGRDLLCVQSMDGRLQIFEQDAHAFTRKLEGCLVPGPLCYVAKLDAFLTCSADMRIQCYKYQVLAASRDAEPGPEDAAAAAPAPGRRSAGGLAGPGGAGPGGGGGGGAGGGGGGGGGATKKRVLVDWSVNLGEHARVITTARFSEGLAPTQVDIVVVGEQSLFVLKERGALRLQKRLDYDAAAACAYPRASGAQAREENLVVCSHTSQLHVYRGPTLVWAARLPCAPVACFVAEFGQMPGLIVTLGDEGQLAVQYLGTDPPTTAVVAPDAKELNYEEIDEEHRQLLQVIRKSQAEGSREARDRLALRAQAPALLDPPPDEGYDADELAEDPEIVRGPDGAPVSVTARLFLSYSGQSHLNNVTVNLSLPSFVKCRETSIKVGQVRGAGGTPAIVPVVLYAARAAVPASLEVRASAAYTTETGEPRTAHCAFRLPLALAARLTPAVKTNTYKFTLDTNRPPCQLVPLFEDMFSQPGLGEDAAQRLAGSANALSFQYWVAGEDGAPLDVTVLVSKAAGRYRIQSASLAALWLVSDDLVRRLAAFYGVRDDSEQSEKPFAVEYTEPLPLQDFYTMIDHHLECRHTLLAKNSSLNDCAHQFRIIEKRLLVRFKDRNPAPLAALDVLMEETYKRLLELAGEVEAAQAALRRAANRLSCTARLILMLVRYRFGLDDTNFNILSANFCPEVVDNPEQGWEELVDAAMTYLLRTALAKTQKETALLQPSVAMPADTAKLRKHISIVCDRLNKGHRLAAPVKKQTPKQKAPPTKKSPAEERPTEEDRDRGDSSVDGSQMDHAIGSIAEEDEDKDSSGGGSGRGEGKRGEGDQERGEGKDDDML